MLKSTISYLLLFFSLLAFSSRAQQNSSATNIRFRADAATRKVIIQYDLATVQPGDSLYVEFETASGRVIRPRTVTGDVGKGIKPGSNKIVYWDVVRDGIPLNEDVRAVVRLVRPLAPSVAAKPPTTTTPTKTKGLEVEEKPKTAAAPVTQPTIERKKSSILPIAGWVVTGGLAVYAFTLASAINKDVDEYNAKEYAENQAELDNFNRIKSSVDSKKGTFTIVAGAAAALAVGNVVYMLVRKPKPSRTAFQITPGTQAVGLGVTYKF